MLEIMGKYSVGFQRQRHGSSSDKRRLLTNFNLNQIYGNATQQALKINQRI